MTDPTAPAVPASAKTVAINDAIATAKNLPDLIDKASAVDPAMAQALSGKALIASKTPWGVLLTALVAYGASKYGVGWSEQTCELVAGAGVLVGSYAMRYLSPGRITGLFGKADTTATDSTVSQKVTQ